MYIYVISIWKVHTGNIKYEICAPTCTVFHKTIYKHITYVNVFINQISSSTYVYWCFIHVCFVQVATCGAPDTLTRLGARIFHTFLDHSTNIIRKVRAPRLVSASGAPNDVQNCHLDKTNMDNSSMQLLGSLFPFWLKRQCHEIFDFCPKHVPRYRY